MKTPANLDSPEKITEHKQVIEKKKILYQVYRQFYKLISNNLNNIPTSGKIVELGSGGGFIKKVLPQVLTSDVVPGEAIDRVFSAEKIPFREKTVSAFIMLDVFHHLKNAEKALKEIERCLKVGGKIIMVDQNNSLWGRFIYKYFHYEKFDPKAGWKVSGKGRMSDSNMALPYIIFKRDKEIFEKKFPKLKISLYQPHTPFGYLVSGGLTSPQFIPSFFYPLVVILEKILSPINNYLGLFITIVITKVK